MSGLRGHDLGEDDGGGGRCAECGRADPAGPCAACESMICPDCGVLSRDPVGHKVLCVSCARLIADVRDRAAPRRGSPGVAFLAVVVAVAIAAIAVSALATCAPPGAASCRTRAMFDAVAGERGGGHVIGASVTGAPRPEPG